MTAVGYGIDFGTTNSAVSIAYDNNEIEIVELEPRSKLPTMLPSVVYLHRDAQRLAGTEAGETYMVTGRDQHRCSDCELVDRLNGATYTDCRTYSRGGGCMDSRLLAGLKLDLADSGFGSTHSWAVDFRIEDLVSVALARLKRFADRASGNDVRRAVFGFPLAFPGAEGPRFGQQQGLAWARLEDAAKRAGFDEVERLAEPHAAAIVEDTDEGTVLALDFGGGTFDVAVIEFAPESAEVTALEGEPIGGEQIDADIFKHTVADALGLSATFGGQSGSTLAMPLWMQRRFRSLAGIKHLVARNDVGAWLREHEARPGGAALSQLRELMYGGQAYAFYRTIEEAKMALSDEDSSVISFHRPGISLDVPLRRSELDRIVAPYLDRIDRCIDRALAKSGVDQTDLAYVVTTGGSSQLRAFQDRLAERFGAEKIRIRDPYNTVVTGLAYDAQGRWA